MSEPQEVIVFGVRYRSRRQACIAHGHNPAKIDHRLRKGMTLDEALSAKNRYTGAKKHPSYIHWNSMRSRCLSGSGGGDYKGRVGICERWKASFWAFVEDMGEPPAEGMTIDRKDGTKGYSKENCRWATHHDQQRNKKNNVYVECFGKNLCLADWEKETGIDRRLIAYRIGRGMDIEKALTLKPKKRGANQ